MPTLRGSASGLVQCLVSSRSTRPVHLRASCRRYDFRAGLIAWLANCVRSDARRRQSRSSLSNCSDFNIAYRLESPRPSVARHRASCRWPTPHTKTKRRPCEAYNVRRCGICLQRKGPAMSQPIVPIRVASESYGGANDPAAYICRRRQQEAAQAQGR
jgi:hypothetical protein